MKTRAELITEAVVANYIHAISTRGGHRPPAQAAPTPYLDGRTTFPSSSRVKPGL
jgi:hypothetical protein